MMATLKAVPRSTSKVVMTSSIPPIPARKKESRGTGQHGHAIYPAKRPDATIDVQSSANDSKAKCFRAPSEEPNDDARYQQPWMQKQSRGAQQIGKRSTNLRNASAMTRAELLYTPRQRRLANTDDYEYN
jgi:hypothetical protein